MGRTTKTMSGTGQTKFFRELFRADGDVPEMAAERLAAVCEARIAQIRVRTVPLEVKAHTPKPATAKAKLEAKTVPASASVTASFDPFAFSVVAMLAKKGKLVLEAKLSEISDTGQLRAIADAQHLGIGAEMVDAGALRAAIVTGAERRMAERKAAAS